MVGRVSTPSSVREELTGADFEVAIVGAGVVGSATALELARRGVAVAVLEAEPEPGLQASGTNSGIVHTGFDSEPSGLETELILRAAELRGPVHEALGVPLVRCGARMRSLRPGDEEAIAALARNAAANRVEAVLEPDGSLAIPGESLTDPVAFTVGLAAAARRHGAAVRTGFEVIEIDRRGGGFELRAADGAAVRASAIVNCAGLGAARVARMAGDDSFDVYPRKGEFLVFDPPPGGLDRILLPVPTKRTKGVLVFPTVDGRVVAGPTAIDQEDARDWSVRPDAREQILPKAAAMFPPLSGAEPVFAYAGLRPAGRGVNYVIGASTAAAGLVNAAAIRSTGLTASLAIAEHLAGLVGGLGIRIRPAAPLQPGPPPPTAGPWWRRTAEYVAG
jgi:glycerol-3-phosphate dehydrogenase